MRVIDLFSGIGGFSLGLGRSGMKTVAFCEIEPYCQALLNKRWPDVPIFNDVKDFDYDGSAELICGGYPCQPFSLAGKRKGKDDDRHLWPEMLNIIQRYKPRWVIGENVAGHIRMGLDNVLSDLESEGYTARAFVIPACAVQAVHRRDRVWIVAHSQCVRCGGRGERQQCKNKKREGGKNKQDNRNPIRPEITPCAERLQGKITNAKGKRIHGKFQKKIQGFKGLSWCEGIGRVKDYFNRYDIPEPLVCRMDDGVSGRVDGLGSRKQRLEGLGNAIVPQIAEIIGTAIMSIESENKDE